jgi:enoyl-CoA hydratase
MRLEGGVAVVTMSNPEVKNGLTFAMCEELIAICDAVDADGSVAALVIAGAGGTFCSGSDTREFEWQSTVDPSSPITYDRTSLIYSSFLRLGRVGVPTIAAVRGAAVGAGLNLALACDLRIVARNARFISGFTKAGVLPGGGFYTLVHRLGGRETAVAMGVLGEVIGGERAVQCGLAWEAVDDAEVEARAMHFAARATADPELARRAITSYRAEVGPPAVSWETAVELERGVQMWSRRRRQESLEEQRHAGQ